MENDSTQQAKNVPLGNTFRLICLTSFLALLVLTPGYYGMHQFYLELEQNVYRDSASYVADELPPSTPIDSSVLDKLFFQFRQQLPNGNLLVYSSDGTLLSATGTCVPADAKRTSQNTETLRPYDGPDSPYYPIVHHPVCDKGERRLSGVRLQGDTTRYLLLVSTDEPLSKLWHDFSTQRLLLLCLAVSFLTLVIGTCISSFWFNRKFKSHLYTLIEQAKRFASGDFSTRFTPGRFVEYQMVADSFNQLAAEVEQRLAELESESIAQRALVSELAHDLRTPTTAIIGCAGFLENENTTSEAASLYRALAEENSRLIEQHLSKLEEYAVVHSKSIKEVPDEHQIDLLISQAISLTLPLAAAKNVRCESKIVKASNATLQFSIHRSLVLRALTNLLDNAIRHSASRAVINIQGRYTDNQLDLEIRNDIAPLSASEVSTASVDLPQHRSAGVGLAVVKKVAALHAGSFSFDIDSQSASAKLTLRAGLSQIGLENAAPATAAQQNDQDLASPLPLLSLALRSIPALAIIAGLAYMQNRVWLGIFAFLLPLAVESIAGLLGRYRPRWVRVLYFLPALSLGAVYISSSVWVFLIGFGLGWYTALFISIARTSTAIRRVSPWTATLLALATLVSVIVQQYGYQIAYRSFVAEVGMNVAHRALASKDSEIGTHFEAHAEQLHRNWQIQPLVDYRIELLAAQPSLAEAIVLEIGSSRPLPILKQRVLAGEVREVIVNNCTENTCYRLVAEAPGQLLRSLANRIFPLRLAQSLSMQFAITLLFLSIASLVWRRRYQKEILDLQNLIDALRKQEYSTEFHESPGAYLAGLGTSLQVLAKRCLALEEELINSRQQFSRFLQLAINLGGIAAKECHQQAVAGQSFSLQAQQLHYNVEQIFQLALFARGSWGEPELFCLTDLVEEECAMSAYGLEFAATSEPIHIVSLPKLWIALWRFLTDEALREGGNTNGVVEVCTSSTLSLISSTRSSHSPQLIEMSVEFPSKHQVENRRPSHEPMWNFINDSLKEFDVKLSRNYSDSGNWRYVATFHAKGSQ